MLVFEFNPAQNAWVLIAEIKELAYRLDTIYY